MAEDKDLIRLKLIKNLFLQKKPAKVSYEIVLLSPATRNQPLPLQFEAEAYFLTGKLEKGLAVLARAAQTHPNEIRFPLKRIVVLAEQQLAQTAIEEALALLDHPECRPENILQVAQIFSNRQDWRSAVLLWKGQGFDCLIRRPWQKLWPSTTRRWASSSWRARSSTKAGWRTTKSTCNRPNCFVRRGTTTGPSG